MGRKQKIVDLRVFFQHCLDWTEKGRTDDATATPKCYDRSDVERPLARNPGRLELDEPLGIAADDRCFGQSDQDGMLPGMSRVRMARPHWLLIRLHIASQEAFAIRFGRWSVNW